MDLFRVAIREANACGESSVNARAAVFRGAGLPIEFQEWPVPTPQESQVLVDVVACTLCGSDIHTMHGRRNVPVPTVLGHEILGRISAYGPTASRVDATGRAIAVGDRVTWAVVANCGQCYYCKRDLPQKCERGFKYGHEAIRPSLELSGGLATHCLLVRGTSIFRIPDSVSDAVACPSSCATATVAGAIEAAGIVNGRSILILGAGMLGITASAWCRSLGADDIILCDPASDRLALAKNFGASETCLPQEIEAVITELTGGRGVDIAFDFSGSHEAIEATIPMLRTGGIFVLIGSVFPTPAVALYPERVVRGCLTIKGMHNYSPRHLGSALQFLESNPNYPFGALVSTWHRLEDVETLIRSKDSGTELRIGIRPNE